jgi:hypothetical protein
MLFLFAMFGLIILFRLANEKLKQMVEDQQIAEQKKKDSQVLSEELDKQNAVISKRREEAYR